MKINYLEIKLISRVAILWLIILSTDLNLTFGQQVDVDNTPGIITNEFGMEFVLIEPGSMLVGRFEIECPTPPDTRDVEERVRWSTADFEKCEELAARDSRPGFWVTLEESYYIGRFTVTQNQWEQVMGENPSYFQGGRVEGDSADHPVDSVTWEDTQRFIDKLNELDPDATYRLPTEFEWEYAARAGANEVHSWREIRDYAWIQDTDKGTTHPVGLKKPNAWGLYDMLGNVWEWVEDYYNEKIFADPVPPKDGEVHVLKGGSFISDVTNATAFFHGGGPGNGYDVGFRLVREVSTSNEME